MEQNNNNWIDTYYIDIMISRINNINDKFINKINKYNSDTYLDDCILKKDINIKDDIKDKILDEILEQIEEKYGKKNNKVMLKSKL